METTERIYNQNKQEVCNVTVLPVLIFSADRVYFYRSQMIIKALMHT